MSTNTPSDDAFLSDPNTALEQVARHCQSFGVDRLPIVSAFCHKIGISQSINSRVNSKAEIDAGTVVTAMILDTLAGRRPLYRFHEFFQHQDTELLLGREIAPERFTDDVLGRALDRLHEADTMKIFTEISLKACRLFGVRIEQGHFDTTSVIVGGDYDNSAAGGSAPHNTYGFSKDTRPDLKQFMFSLLCVEGNIPLLGKVEDGNAADGKLNNEHLQQVAKLITENQIERDNFLYVADCKLVNEANLELLGSSPFVTRLPASYKAHEEVVDAALVADEWEALGTLNKTPASARRPAAIYKVAERRIELYGRTYRAIVVHSSNHDKRRQKRIDRKLKEARDKAQKAIKTARREIFSCEKDARAALQKLEETFSGELWQVNGMLEPSNIHAPGKVAAGKERKVRRVDYRLRCEAQENQKLAARFRAHAGCFVLLCNAPQPEAEQAQAGAEANKTDHTTGSDKQEKCVHALRGWSAGQCLEAYKGQHGVEGSFSFLKEPLIVNDVFLKKPSRIDALGLVLLLSLLIWSLMQRSLRKSVEEHPERILKDLANRPTKRPTAFIMAHKFLSVTILKIGNHRRLAHPLRRDQVNYLRALGLDPTIFTTPAGKSSRSKPMKI
jgi:transposase